ncbi:hypothetical protein DDE82_003528 [Stemphylium lycopersici]|uniref:Uncharacterized protein n=1 Tax=Stemphylium lycopersici TaxID=183478 RepID=A0A364NCH0_STELY|nr:hypothetical protein TW65_00591 [Stemphylium lycopersici]RAR06178.1 hypothetical protein DDE82_003528 [Stemphylium lycopersici]RAR14897.1 hypothetical protein DDE83_001735 [Stemphylium lycopersici]
MAPHLITVDSPVSDFDSEWSKDLEFLYETFEGIGFVIADNDFEEDESIAGSTVEQTPAPVSSVGFLGLPAELRCHVYPFLLPHDMIITFERYDVVDGQPVYNVLGRWRGETSAVRMGGNPFYTGTHILRDNRMTVETQLFRGFAQRNGISIPDDIDKFWATDD